MPEFLEDVVYPFEKKGKRYGASANMWHTNIPFNLMA